MKAFIPLFVITILLSLILTWIARRIALYNNLTDKPNFRKLQRVPIPYLGGVAIAATTLTLISYLATRYDLEPISQVGISTLLLLSLVIVFVGLIDDIAVVHYRTKFAFQTTVAIGASLALANSTTKVQISNINFLNTSLTVVTTVAFMNAVNFMDNMNGLTAGTLAIALSFLSVIARNNNQDFISVSSLIIASSLIGFLPWNFPKARIFLGDAGTLFLGFIISTIGIQLSLTQIQKLISVLIIFQLFSVHILDFLFVITFRLLRGVNPATPGRDHFSHRLEQLGFSQNNIAYFLWTLSFLSGVAALSASRHLVVSLIMSVAILLCFVGVYFKTAHRNY